MTCLDFGAERHKTHNGTEANLCDKFESLRASEEDRKEMAYKEVLVSGEGARGITNSHYSLDRNINEVQVIQSFVPPNINDEEPTASLEHADLNILPGQTAENVNVPATTHTTESNNNHLHTHGETAGNSIQVGNSGSSRISWSLIHANERHINKQWVDLSMGCTKILKLNKHIAVLKRQFVNEQKLNQNTK
jgi:hypothetical protein